MSSSDPGKPIVLIRLPTEILASVLPGRLQDEGIRTEMSGALAPAFRADDPGEVQVVVPAKDAEPAVRLLAALHGDRG